MSLQSWRVDLADFRQPVDRPLENVGSIPVGAESYAKGRGTG